MLDLDTLPGLHMALLSSGNKVDHYRTREKAGRMYCIVCVEETRMDIEVISYSGSVMQDLVDSFRISAGLEKRDPSLFRYRCIHCDCYYTALVYSRSGLPDLVVFPNRRGGLSTPRTPDAIAYFMDEAHRSRAVGAYSTSMAMLRSALDQLLSQQSFKGGLRSKIEQLKEAIERKEAPEWASQLSAAVIEIIKEIGDSQIHPTDDISTVKSLTREKVLDAETALLHLIHTIYEKPYELKKRLDALNAVLAKARDRKAEHLDHCPPQSILSGTTTSA